MLFRNVKFNDILSETPYISMHASRWMGRKDHHTRGYATDVFVLPIEPRLVYFCVAFANGLVKELRWVTVPKVAYFLLECL